MASRESSAPTLRIVVAAAAYAAVLAVAVGLGLGLGVTKAPTASAPVPRPSASPRPKSSPLSPPPSPTADPFAWKFAPGAEAQAAGVLSASGWALPSGGPPPFIPLAPSQVTVVAGARSTLHLPIGRAAADRIARGLGLDSRLLTPTQAALLLSGGGVDGNASQAAIINASVAILTNTAGRPYNGAVLASYGLVVYEGMPGFEGVPLLMSPAHDGVPTREINSQLVPGGYINVWLRANNASEAAANLYTSAYVLEAPFGSWAQSLAGVAQLAANQKPAATSPSYAGMSVLPSLCVRGGCAMPHRATVVSSAACTTRLPAAHTRSHARSHRTSLQVARELLPHLPPRPQPRGCHARAVGAHPPQRRRRHRQLHQRLGALRRRLPVPHHRVGAARRGSSKNRWASRSAHTGLITGV